jgi:hypothetical protein
MHHEGPPLEALTRRLAETPEDFLREPKIAARGEVHVAAVVRDLFRLLGQEVSGSDLLRFESSDSRNDRNRLAVALIASWLLADHWFCQQDLEPGKLLTLFAGGIADLSSQIGSRKFVADPDRREEMARFVLANLGFRPLGESLEQAQDRLMSLSSTERTRVMRAAREAERRARVIRDALARKAAEESADKWTRE